MTFREDGDLSIPDWNSPQLRANHSLVAQRLEQFLKTQLTDVRYEPLSPSANIEFFTKDFRHSTSLRVSLFAGDCEDGPGTVVSLKRLNTLEGGYRAYSHSVDTEDRRLCRAIRLALTGSLREGQSVEVRYRLGEQPLAQQPEEVVRLRVEGGLTRILNGMNSDNDIECVSAMPNLMRLTGANCYCSRTARRAAETILTQNNHLGRSIRFILAHLIGNLPSYSQSLVGLRQFYPGRVPSNVRLAPLLVIKNIIEHADADADVLLGLEAWINELMPSFIKIMNNCQEDPLSAHVVVRILQAIQRIMPEYIAQNVGGGESLSIAIESVKTEAEANNRLRLESIDQLSSEALTSIFRHVSRFLTGVVSYLEREVEEEEEEVAFFVLDALSDDSFSSENEASVTLESLPIKRKRDES